MDEDKEIASDFFPLIGRVAVKYARLDSAMTGAISTLINDDPVSRRGGVVAIKSLVPDDAFRVLISCVTIKQKAEMIRRLAKRSFPDEGEYIGKVFKTLEEVIEDRNVYMHHVWCSGGQLGFNPRGTFKKTDRTREEIIAFGDKIIALIDHIDFLHPRLLGEDMSPKPPLD